MRKNQLKVGTDYVYYADTAASFRLPTNFANVEHSSPRMQLIENRFRLQNRRVGRVTVVSTDGYITLKLVKKPEGVGFDHRHLNQLSEGDAFTAKNGRPIIMSWDDYVKELGDRPAQWAEEDARRAAAEEDCERLEKLVNSLGIRADWDLDIEEPEYTISKDELEKIAMFLANNSKWHHSSQRPLSPPVIES